MDRRNRIVNLTNTIKDLEESRKELVSMLTKKIREFNNLNNIFFKMKRMYDNAKIANDRNKMKDFEEYSENLNILGEEVNDLQQKMILINNQKIEAEQLLKYTMSAQNPYSNNSNDDDDDDDDEMKELLPTGNFSRYFYDSLDNPPDGNIATTQLGRNNNNEVGYISDDDDEKGAPAAASSATANKNENLAGRKKKHSGDLQAILFDKKYNWTVKEAKKELKRMKLKMLKGKEPHETKNLIRMRLKNPNYKKYGYRTIWLSEQYGIKAIYEFPK